MQPFEADVIEPLRQLELNWQANPTAERTH
jgi:hypothetical protein